MPDTDEVAVRTAHSIVQKALEDEASEIHIEPAAEAIHICFRLGTELQEAMRLPAELHEELIARFKEMAGMSAAEPGAAREGHIGISCEGREYDLRVRSQAAAAGERLVMIVSPRE